jgi:hypothetical protein
MNEIIQQLTEAATTFLAHRRPDKAEVCRDIAAKLRRYGRWASERQQQYGQALIAQARALAAGTSATAAARGEEQRASAPEVGEAALRRINELFAAALRAGLRRPKIRLRTAARRRIVLTPGREGAVYVKAERFGHLTYIGTITPQGEFRRGSRFLSSLHDEVLSLVRAFGTDPLREATAYGRATGSCCFCGRTLTDSRSVAMGYGPICAGHYGLEWGERRAAEVAVRAGGAEVSVPRPASLAVSTSDAQFRRRIRRGGLPIRFRSPRISPSYGAGIPSRPIPERSAADTPLNTEDEDQHFM